MRQDLKPPTKQCCGLGPLLARTIVKHPEHGPRQSSSLRSAIASRKWRKRGTGSNSSSIATASLLAEWSAYLMRLGS